MSLFTAGRVQPGMIRPQVDGGGTDYFLGKTKVSQITKPEVQPTYGFEIYKQPPAPLDLRSGHTCKVMEKPVSVSTPFATIENIFSPGNPEMEELTQYFSRVVPSQNKSVSSAITIKQYGTKELLDRFLQSKLQDDVNIVNARMAGATEVERQLAMARLQDRYSNYIRSYGTEERVRQAILRDVVGGIEEPAIRGALQMELRHTSATGGATALPISAGDVSTMGGAGADLDRSAYYDGVEQTLDSGNLDDVAQADVEQVDYDDAQQMEEITSRINYLSTEAGRLIKEKRKAEIDGDTTKLRQIEKQFSLITLQIQTLETQRSVIDGGLPVSSSSGTEEQPIDTLLGDPIPPGGGSLEPDFGDGMNVMDGGASATEYRAGTYVRAIDRERPIQGVHGSVRVLREQIPVQPPAAAAAALASQDVGASQSYRQEVADMASRLSSMIFPVRLDERTAQPVAAASAAAVVAERPRLPARVSGGAYIEPTPNPAPVRRGRGRPRKNQ